MIPDWFAVIIFFLGIGIGWVSRMYFEIEARRDEELVDKVIDLVRCVGRKEIIDRNTQLEEWFSQCMTEGYQSLTNSIEINSKRRGGIPVLKGTRFTVGQILAELAESSGVSEIATNFNLDETAIKEMLLGLSLITLQPYR